MWSVPKHCAKDKSRIAQFATYRLDAVIVVGFLTPNCLSPGRTVQQPSVTIAPIAQPKSNDPGAPKSAATKPTSAAPTEFAPWENILKTENARPRK